MGKTMKFKWLTRFGLLGLLCSGLLGGALSASAKVGVDSSGGGGVYPVAPLELEELRNEIKDLNTPRSFEEMYSHLADIQALPIKFAYVQATYGTEGHEKTYSNLWNNPSFIEDELKRQHPERVALLQKLFPKSPGPDVISVLKKTKFYLKENGPCFDRDGKAVDASAFPFESRRVCFSAPLLLAKLHRESARDQLRALAIHEVSHKLGTTQLEAELLQVSYYTPLPSALRGVEKLVQTMDFLVNQLEAVKRSIESNGSLVQTCGRLARADERFTHALDDGNGGGHPSFSSISGVRIEHEMDAIAVWARVFLLQTGCLNSSDVEREEIMKPFGARTQMPLREFIYRYHALTIPALTPFGETVSALPYGDLNGMLKEISELIDRSHALTTAIKKDAIRD